jgi:CDGSH-type Zn-finger protein
MLALQQSSQGEMQWHAQCNGTYSMKITALKSGAFLVEGDFSFVDASAAEYERAASGECMLGGCGKAGQSPFCDGVHCGIHPSVGGSSNPTEKTVSVGRWEDEGGQTVAPEPLARANPGVESEKTSDLDSGREL